MKSRHLHGSLSVIGCLCRSLGRELAPRQFPALLKLNFAAHVTTHPVSKPSDVRVLWPRLPAWIHLCVPCTGCQTAHGAADMRMGVESLVLGAAVCVALLLCAPATATGDAGLRRSLSNDDDGNGNPGYDHQVCCDDAWGWFAPAEVEMVPGPAATARVPCVVCGTPRLTCPRRHHRRPRTRRSSSLRMSTAACR